MRVLEKENSHVLLGSDEHPRTRMVRSSAGIRCDVQWTVRLWQLSAKCTSICYNKTIICYFSALSGVVCFSSAFFCLRFTDEEKISISGWWAIFHYKMEIKWTVKCASKCGRIISSSMRMLFFFNLRMEENFFCDAYFLRRNEKMKERKGELCWCPMQWKILKEKTLLQSFFPQNFLRYLYTNHFHYRKLNWRAEGDVNYVSRTNWVCLRQTFPKLSSSLEVCLRFPALSFVCIKFQENTEKLSHLNSH